MTINALLATAGWIDGLYVTTLDQTGTAQKGGAVVSHIMLSRRPVEAPARTNTGNADVILGFDLIGVANAELLKTASPEKTTAVLNTNVTPTIDNIRSRTPIAGPERMLEAVQLVTRRGHNIVVDGTRLAEGLFGSHMAVNLFMLGVAWQGGLIPLTLSAIEQAVRLNGVDIDRNLQVFTWGRKYYHDAASVEQLLKPKQQRLVAFDRASELTAYQNVAYARQYVDFIEDVDAKGSGAGRHRRAKFIQVDGVQRRVRSRAAAHQADRLKVRSGTRGRRSNRSPTICIRLCSGNSASRRSSRIGPWFRRPLKMLAAMKGLRGGAFDIFGRSKHRRMERELIGWYRDLITQVIERNPPQAQEIAALPDQIRGYEQIKEASIAKVKQQAVEMLRESQREPVLSRE